LHFASLDLELIARIVVGTVLGGIIGYERDVHGRPAGLRTHAVVALASSTFMVVSSHFVYFQNYHHDDLINVDTSRIAASVVSGIGFLAGGAILRTGLNVQGLTTAAGLWLVAAIGLCAGSGMYFEGVAVTILGVAVLAFLRRFEHDKDDRVQRLLTLTLKSSSLDPDAMIARLAELDAPAVLEAWRTENNGALWHLTLTVRLRRDEGARRIAAFVAGVPEIVDARLEP
jgi:putative Mg2+ transporter-C (MgtC) family protein